MTLLLLHRNVEQISVTLNSWKVYLKEPIVSAATRWNQRSTFMAYRLYAMKGFPVAAVKQFVCVCVYIDGAICE